MKKILIILLTFLLVSCSSTPKLDEKNYKEVMFDEILKKIDNDESFVYYIGYDSCSACKQYLKTLSTYFKTHGEDVIYYVDSDKNFIENKPYANYKNELAHIAYLLYGESSGFEDALYTPTTFKIVNGEYAFATIGNQIVEMVETVFDTDYNNVKKINNSLDDAIDLINSETDFRMMLLFDGNNKSKDAMIEINGLRKRDSEIELNLLTLNSTTKDDEKVKIIENFVNDHSNNQFTLTKPTLIKRVNNQITIDFYDVFEDISQFMK